MILMQIDKELVTRNQNVSPKLLLEFVKALVQEVQNSDVFLLALARAKRTSGASDAEVAILHEAVLNESKKNSIYPKGFMP